MASLIAIIAALAIAAALSYGFGGFEYGLVFILVFFAVSATAP